MSKRQMWARLTNHTACPSRASPPRVRTGTALFYHPKSRVIVTLRNLKVCMYLLIQLMTKMCSFSILKLVRLKVDLSLLLVE